MTVEHTARFPIARLPRAARQYVLRIGAAVMGTLLVQAAPFAAAAGETPLGTWTTIDDDSGKPRALVQIQEQDGALSGRIVRLFRDPGEDPAPRCEDCKGERHGQPVIGMTILWNMRLHGNEWSGGEILDPETGKIYRCHMHTTADGRQLEVRGFIGISLLGRTQTWQRADAP